MPAYASLISQTSYERAQDYLAQLRTGSQPGAFLQTQLAGADLASLTVAEFLEKLVQTKRPQIFAESAVMGDGSDWNLAELGLLGDISMATPVTFFDNGRHTHPDVHNPPFTGWLLFVAGALLKNGRSHTPADWIEVVTNDGQIDEEAYFRLYERRLLPGFLFINEQMQQQGKTALITVPGLGCGVFAGPFRGQLGEKLKRTLQAFVLKHAAAFSHIRAVYYDPYNEGQNERHEIGAVSLLVRPLTHGNEHKPQLCRPTTYAEPGDNFSDCELVSVVAWDHVSWPGNDFYAGSRLTDDGVKGAATDVTAVLTSVSGTYNPQTNQYEPPASYHTWSELISKYNLDIDILRTLLVLPPA